MSELKDIRNLNFQMYMARLPLHLRKYKTSYCARQFLRRWREHVKGLRFNEGYV